MSSERITRRRFEATSAKRSAGAGPRVHIKAVKAWRGVRRIALVDAALLTLAHAAPEVRGDVTVVLTTDRAIRALNRKFRGKDQPTDVLSFDIGSGCESCEWFSSE